MSAPTLSLAAAFFEAAEYGPQPSFAELWTFSGSGERHIVSDSKLRQVAAKTSLFLAGNAGSVEEMATVLIGTYVGLAATRVNAPSSSSVH
ncbi:hypothetical protein ELH85_30685 (plasmid) [Rhizobium ruizarguesonis]|nr:hypothetical protein ELH85_30685 [Rhizobium ruizarguesonis]TBA33755.1 hypothetical protein ELH62_32405 [Rhizobium ruizarguesonis]